MVQVEIARPTPVGRAIDSQLSVVDRTSAALGPIPNPGE
jgi:hypothetical protein